MKYEEPKQKLLNDESICKENRELFKEFFIFEERKLKRINDLRELDEGTYRTLYGFISKFRNVNKWFGNKPLKDITREDIKQVYDDLEDGKILSSKGKPFEDRKSYYNKIFKSKLFQMVGKADLAREELEFCKPNGEGEVRFIEETDFRKLVDFIIQPKQKLLAWLSFDIGENINSLLKLKKEDCKQKDNKENNQKEYHINFVSIPIFV